MVKNRTDQCHRDALKQRNRFALKKITKVSIHNSYDTIVFDIYSISIDQPLEPDEIYM